MSSAPKPKRVQYHSGSFGALDGMLAHDLGVAEGAEIDVHVEDGRLVIEPVRPKLVERASDVGARADRQKRITESIRHVLDKHEEAFALLAK